MKPNTHPDSSVNQIPSGPDVGRTISYVLRSNQPTIRVLRKLVQEQFENILDVTTEDVNMRGTIFAYKTQQKLSRKEAEYMRRFLWGKFVVYQEGDECFDQDETEDFGSADLEELGKQIRELFMIDWWGEHFEETSAVSVAIIQGIVLYYGYDGEEPRENIGGIKTKKKNNSWAHKRQKDEYYGGMENIQVLQEDRKSMDIILSLVESYFDAIDMKMDKEKDSKALSRESVKGRWRYIYGIILELKKLSLKTKIIDGFADNNEDDDEGGNDHNDFADRLQGILRLADTYAILQDDEKET